MQAAAQLMPSGTVIAKRGPDGASGLEDGTLHHVPAPIVTPVDTIGAGDIFNAGYLAARARHASLGDAVAAGVITATRAISTHPREYLASVNGPTLGLRLGG